MIKARRHSQKEPPLLASLEPIEDGLVLVADDFPTLALVFGYFPHRDEED